MSVMTSTPSSFASALAGAGLLRLSLGLDAFASAAFAAPMTFASGLLSDVLGLPASLLFGAGCILWLWTAFLIVVVRQRMRSPPAVSAVIIVNLLWAVGTAILWASGWVEPTFYGRAFLAVNVVGVAFFALLQFLGMRRARLAPAP